MSKLTEYLKLVPRGIKNADKIVEAIVNNVKIELGTIPQRDLEVITSRRIICQTCPYMSRNAVALGVYATDREDDHCIHCGCPIATKSASLESNCGIEEFNNDNPENQIPLKWIAVKN